MASKRRRILEKLARVDRFIKIHEVKIGDELSKLAPDHGLILHWQSEIRGAQKARVRYERKLHAVGRKT